MRLLLPSTDNLVIYFNLWMCFTTPVGSHTHTHTGGGRHVDSNTDGAAAGEMLGSCRLQGPEIKPTTF